MSVAGVFRLGAGEVGPLQQSRVSCGAACLTVSRMMIDPGLTAWITRGVGGPGQPTDSRTPSARFAEHEQLVLARTNAARPRGAGWQLPWPSALGTPPWGALGELEHGAAAPGTHYRIGLLRGLHGPALRRSLEHVLACLQPGAPALLYVGNATMPRHVTLLYLHDTDPEPDLYDPGTGRAGPVPRAEFERGTAVISGWRRPWLAVYPRDERRAGGELPAWWPSRVLGDLPAGALARQEAPPGG